MLYTLDFDAADDDDDGYDKDDLYVPEYDYIHRVYDYGDDNDEVYEDVCMTMISMTCLAMISMTCIVQNIKR